MKQRKHCVPYQIQLKLNMETINMYCKYFHATAKMDKELHKCNSEQVGLMVDQRKDRTPSYHIRHDDPELTKPRRIPHH